MAKLRLIKVLVQPVFVLVDDEIVTEVDHAPIAVPASEWPTYSSERFPAEVRAWQAQLDAEAKEPDAGAPRNRAARRSGKSGS